MFDKIKIFLYWHKVKLNNSGIIKQNEMVATNIDETLITFVMTFLNFQKKNSSETSNFSYMVRV